MIYIRVALITIIILTLRLKFEKQISAETLVKEWDYNSLLGMFGFFFLALSFMDPNNSMFSYYFSLFFMWAASLISASLLMVRVKILRARNLNS